MKDISSTTGTSPIKNVDLEVELQVHCLLSFSPCFQTPL